MATRTTRKKRKTAPRKNQPLPGWIWLVTGLIIGLSATFLPSINESLNNKSKHNKTITTKEAPSVAPVAKRTFDFYTLLPELEVVVDKDSTPPNSSPSQTHSDSEYVLQVGSFKSGQEADSLKAQLALMGVETNIEIVKVNTINWHRVRIGPSKNIEQLQATQKRLRKRDMDSILLKVRS